MIFPQELETIFVECVTKGSKETVSTRSFIAQTDRIQNTNNQLILVENTAKTGTKHLIDAVVLTHHLVP